MALRFTVPSLLALSISSLITTSVVAQDRKIEEIVITAEKREATVSDTSISITAFTSETIEDFGIQSADEMINFIPATTRDEYDVRIRGVGRNFRALGGDPGVATYYNGVFSPDFGIASSEAGLYDLERVEALRGPQGTLYGRNAVGGAINYITKKPTFETQGEIRVQLGDFDTQEVYGILSGPIIDEKLAARLVYSKRDRDPWQEGIDGYDTDSTDDENVALSLTWQVTDDIVINMRANDRESDAIIGSRVIINEGTGPNRGVRSIDQAVMGLREVPAGTAGAWSYTEPNTGEVKWALNRRPGVDRGNWPYQPNAAYMQGALQSQISGSSKSDPNDLIANNSETGGDCNDFPSTQNSCNGVFFGHRAGHVEITWDINETTTLNYIFGHNDFDYTYNQDIDYSNAEFSKYRQTVWEEVQNHSHELQLHWSYGDNWSATSGLYYSDEARNQDYSLTNSTPRFTEAFDYGNLAPWFNSWMGAMPSIYEVDNYTSVLSLWDGDPRGDVYHHDNRVTNQAFAVYTQGTYTFNDEFSLVVGLRWAKDKKSGEEKRRSYSTALPGPDGDDWVNVALGSMIEPAAWCGGYNPLECFSGNWGGTDAAAGRTELAMLNVMYGRATWGVDGIDPVCDITDAGCTTPLLLGGVPFAQTSATYADDEWSDVNYRVNLDWTPTDDILIYASVTTGYRAGGFSLGVTDARLTLGSDGLPSNIAHLSDPFSYDEETVLSTELGYKGMHFDDTLSVAVSLYRYTYKNYQDRLNVYSQSQGRAVNVVENANGAVNQGFEVEAMWFQSNELTVGGNYSYTDTEYSKSYIVVVDNDPTIPQSLFGTPATNPDLYTFDAKGSELKRIPKHKFTVWGAYEWPTSFGPVTWRASYAYTGEMAANGAENYWELIPDRFRLDTSIGWKSNDERWSGRLFVDNLTDEHNLRGVDAGAESTNYRISGSMLYPRYWGLDLTYRFGVL